MISSGGVSGGADEAVDWTSRARRVDSSTPGPGSSGDGTLTVVVDMVVELRLTSGADRDVDLDGNSSFESNDWIMSQQQDRSG